MSFEVLGILIVLENYWSTDIIKDSVKYDLAFLGKQLLSDPIWPIRLMQNSLTCCCEFFNIIDLIVKFN